jgi:hypothetical protein
MALPYIPIKSVGVGLGDDMTDEEEFERCWAVLWLMYITKELFAEEVKPHIKKMFKANWDAQGGLDWFNELLTRDNKREK